MIQSRFAGDAVTHCKLCGMSYQNFVEKDRKLHAKHHASFVNGPVLTFEQPPLKVERLRIQNKTVECKVYEANKTAGQIKKVDKLVAMVNQELGAPAENPAWKGPNGKAFVVFIDKRAVGLCITEKIEDVDRQGRWMVARTQQVLGHVNKAIKIGVSRIWIAPTWRRRGLGAVLLDTVCRHLVYGVTFKKEELAFSQPSFAGGLLAKAFNGVVHKSGETLVPVYLE